MGRVALALALELGGAATCWATETQAEMLAGREAWDECRSQVAGRLATTLLAGVAVVAFCCRESCRLLATLTRGEGVAADCWEEERLAEMLAGSLAWAEYRTEDRRLAGTPDAGVAAT